MADSEGGKAPGDMVVDPDTTTTGTNTQSSHTMAATPLAAVLEDAGAQPLSVAPVLMMRPATTSHPPSSLAAPLGGGSVYWEPLRQRLVDGDLEDSLAAAQELIAGLDLHPTPSSQEFSLMLSALLPAFSSVLAHKTKPTANTKSTEDRLRRAVLEWMGKLPSNDALRPHAPHLVAVAMDVLTRDYEENAVAASLILFDLYKTYRTLPADFVQPYLEFVAALYRALPTAVMRNFNRDALLGTLSTTTIATKIVAATALAVGAPNEEKDETSAMDIDPTEETATPMEEDQEGPTPAEPESSLVEQAVPATDTETPGSPSTVASLSTPDQQHRIAVKSGISFRVLTECPLIVMLMFQLYPKFMKTNIPNLIKVMMESLTLRPPLLQTLVGTGGSGGATAVGSPLSAASENTVETSQIKRAYHTRTRELVAAQAKTLSFLTYLLRTFSAELKPYEDRLASNVVALMTTCPRESVSTRKELLVATRHLLNSDFRAGFFRHIDAMLDERVLTGASLSSHSSRSDPSLIRPLAYTALSDFVQHVRTQLSMAQMSKVVCLFSRVLHDASMTLPLTTQYTAIRTLLSLLELIYHNKDPNGQLGRDMLVRVLGTFTDKLEALSDYFPVVREVARRREELESKRRPFEDKSSFANQTENNDAAQERNPLLWLMSHHMPTHDSVKDVQNMIRAIVMGQKTVIFFISNYRTQRAELAASAANDPSGATTVQDTPMPPPGSNEEVSTSMLKLTHTETEIIDRYILTCLAALKLLTKRGVVAGLVRGPTLGCEEETETTEGRSLANEKGLNELHREALTYFAASFTALDSYNLRRSLGRRLDLLIDAIVEDPTVMVVPRHLLGSNATTSFEVCNILLDFLVDRLDVLGYPKLDGVVFLEDESGRVSVERDYLREHLQKISQRPAENEEKIRQQSVTFLQLFERILKSLSVFPDNEVVVRKHLRRIVAVCLRTSMENVDSWPESYCMLLRYVFRSISAGKFEESYKELLPLIPTVLNGLYRVVFSSQNAVLRYTAIELCLTIPARLSSLLPHMNLLVRIIVPALDSNVGDLVNLGLRTLEFWVDNLNPIFLYPEMSKQTELFTALMQALSRHLKPAPYPYGLLTLRLLGKLGGRNRQFLREPLLLCDPECLHDDFGVFVGCSWANNVDDAMDVNNEAVSGTKEHAMSLRLPLKDCLSTLRALSFARNTYGKADVDGLETNYRKHAFSLWECKIENFDVEAYSRKVIEETQEEQALACLAVLRAAIEIVIIGADGPSGAEAEWISDQRRVCVALLFACMIEVTQDESWTLLKGFVSHMDNKILSESLAAFVSEPCHAAVDVAKQLFRYLRPPDAMLDKTQNQHLQLFDALIDALCEICCASDWERQTGPQELISTMMDVLGPEWSRKHEVKLIYAVLLPLKTIPRELSSAAIGSLRIFCRVCQKLYGEFWVLDGVKDLKPNAVLRDMLVLNESPIDLVATTGESSGGMDHKETETDRILRPCDEVFRMVVNDLASTQQLVRFAARFLLGYFAEIPASSDTDQHSDPSTLIRRTLFSRSLRLLPLPQQVGVVDGLAAVIKKFPSLLSLMDQHLLGCLSELLKMSSVADGEMVDEKLKDMVVDKDGYAPTDTPAPSDYPDHSSSLFFRRECVVDLGTVKMVVPAELPSGIQLRVSTIVLLHLIIRTYTDPFFDSEASTSIGNIRPHVISVLFRSLVSRPLKAVDSAHFALRDVLSLCVISRPEAGSDVLKSHSRLPKELLQTCIRPVLLNLRDYTRLTVPLLRGLSRLLSLLSSWFNKTLGEKLLDHLQKWTDPSTIISQGIWKEGEEPLVAAAIVGIFSSLPHASHFVEHLVKLCIKLESALPTYKARFIESPFRRPLARFLNKHPQYTVNFFFPRLKTPMYSEVFQHVLSLAESSDLREFLSNKQCSVMILNSCFERPLAIIRAEKGQTSSGSSKSSLLLHGIVKGPVDESGQRPMNIEAQELQLQGFCMVETLLANNFDYFRDHNDIVRAMRWLWRSKGRAARIIHEDVVSPRFQNESKTLAGFLVRYAKLCHNDDLDILFELLRVYQQPSTSNFYFVSRFLTDMVTLGLSLDQKNKVIERFFLSTAGDSNEDSKVLGIQFLIYPMLAADYCNRVKPIESTKPTTFDTSAFGTSAEITRAEPLANTKVIEQFVKEIIIQKAAPISSGPRLKVEILRLIDLFVEYDPVVVEPFRKEMFKYCWGLLKSDDVSVKFWAYLVQCRFISVYETPLKLVSQCYVALIRSHQQEAKDLVRGALDLLVPSLPIRLSAEDLQKLFHQTNQILIDEGNSIPQLAHIYQIIAAHPDVYFSNCCQFTPYMISSLHRLGLPPNGPYENRVIAADVVDLVLFWDKTLELTVGSRLINTEHAETIVNCLLRLKLLLAEVSADSRHSKIDSSSVVLSRRVSDLFTKVFSEWKPLIRAAPLDKIISKDPKTPPLILACLELVSSVVQNDSPELPSLNSTTAQKIIAQSVELCQEDSRLQDQLRLFVRSAKVSVLLSSFMMIALENVVEEANRDIKKSGSPTRGLDTSRSRTRDRASGTDDGLALASHALFALELLSELIHSNAGSSNAILIALLSYAKSLSKNHLVEAATKHRQSSPNAPRTAAPGTRYHTPTIGILEEASLRHQTAGSKVLIGKSRSAREDAPLPTPIRSLIIILSIFEESNIIYEFSQNRKGFFQLLTSILESSDNGQLLMITVRCIGKWILAGRRGIPLTTKEKSNLLGRLAAFDFNNLPDDVAAQPLSDLVTDLVLSLSFQSQILREDEFQKLLAASLLNAQQSSREKLLSVYIEEKTKDNNVLVSRLLWRIFHSDFEGLGSRLWIVVFVDSLLRHVVSSERDCVNGLRVLAHGNTSVCLQLFETLFLSAWNCIPNDGMRVNLISSMESLLSKTYHSQILRTRTSSKFFICMNSVKAMLCAVQRLRPTPVLDTFLLVSLAEKYNCWYEVLSLLEIQYQVLKQENSAETTLSAIRHCYRQLGEQDAWYTWAGESLKLDESRRAISLDRFGIIEDAVSEYEALVNLVDSPSCTVEPSFFEMDLWEERWVLLQKEMCQLDVVSEFAIASESSFLQLECAWKARDWTTVRKLCSSNELFAAIENGDPVVKMSETILAVADGKLSEVENLHAQTAQLCLHKWQLLPQISSGSMSHASLLHFFHRLVEIRESGQIMVETSNHSSGGTLPDLKNLLNAWRHRLPNDWEPLSTWDEVFAWRTHMFSAITSNFHFCEPDTLATLHDKPWASIRMAKTARKQGHRDVALFVLNKPAEEQAMSVSDAYLKLREQILGYFNIESIVERHVGLNMINTTNLSFFDASQKTEIFRLKAIFLQSLQGRSKANQAFCHSVQICPTYGRAWDSWGELCASLGTVTEKQIEQQQKQQQQSGSSESVPEASTKDLTKKVRQYLAQAMGCYLEAIQIDCHEWARIRIPKCLWLLTKDGSSPSVLCQTFEARGSQLPPWVWLPWIPQLLTGLYRREGQAIKAIFSRIVRLYPQAVYYPLRAFYLERRDVDRVIAADATQQGSVARAEELMTLLRRSHAPLWSSLESVLEELIVKFRPSYEEELLSTIIVLFERAETQLGPVGKKDDENSIVVSVWKTVGKIAVKFFRPADTNASKHDARAQTTAAFKEAYKTSFENDFEVSSTESTSSSSEKPSMNLSEIVGKLRSWKEKLEDIVLASPTNLSLIKLSHTLAMFGVGDAPDLWPDSCTPNFPSSRLCERENSFDADAGTTKTTTSSSAAAARKAANGAATACASAARREGVGGDYGGGSAWIEVPGQYTPNSSAWTDIKPSPELHAKLLKFEPVVEVIRRSDTLVRRLGMVASDGKTYKFRLQFAVQYLTRTDERTSQTHYILDKVLRKEVRSYRAHLSVQLHAVIPVAQRLRLIGETDSRSSLDDVYRLSCSKNRMDYLDLSQRFNDEVKEILAEKDSQLDEEKDRGPAEKDARLKVFLKISSDCNDDLMLAKYLLSKFACPELFYHFRRMFAQQWAANCLLQYAFSAAERTPPRVVFDYCTGCIQSPDFRISYTNQGCFENQPIPFRLTPNLKSLIGFPLLDSRFVTSIGTIADAVNSCREDIDPIFRLLMRDDLVAFYTKSIAKADSKTCELEKQLAGSAARNVAILQSRFSECSPFVKKSAEKENDKSPVDQRIKNLVERARDPERLCMMPGDFQGWL